MIFTFIKSSLGRKILMSMTGFFLIFFLIFHLTINLFIFSGEKNFNKITHFIENNYLISMLQYILALGFIIHIIIGILLHIQNKNARGKIDYYINKWSANSSFNSRTMIYTGIMILCFLIIHLYNFLIPIKIKNIINNYELITNLFKNPIYIFIYILSFIILTIHLSHGFKSAFQSLGILNKRYSILIRNLGIIYYCLIFFGFSIIVIWSFL